MREVNSKVTIAGVRFGNRLMNGAYIHSKSLDDVEVLASSRAGAVVVGSVTIATRKGNPGQVYWRHKEGLYALNSFGMPNGGWDYYMEHLPQMVKIAHSRNRPLLVSVVGFSNSEFVRLIGLAKKSNADMVEVNLGCPNVWDGGSQKRIISYHASLVKKTLAFIKKHDPDMPVSVKISPLPPDILIEVAQEIARSGVVQVVTATNSYPNASTSKGTTTEVEWAYAGMSGRALKPISLSVVRQLREVLPDTIDIIGCGGISTVSDVEDYLKAGAKAVQIATALMDDGPSVFEKILYNAQ